MEAQGVNFGLSNKYLEEIIRGSNIHELMKKVWKEK